MEVEKEHEIRGGPGDADARRLDGGRLATGLTPLVWGAIVVAGVLGVLVWQLA